jgi:hypothetical protein
MQHITYAHYDDVLFGFRCHVDWLVGANVVEKCVVSMFWAEVMSWDSTGIIQNGRRGSLKERANQARVKQRLCLAKQETTCRHQKRSGGK